MVVMEVCKSGMPCFSCQSLLLSTTVLNDIFSGMLIERDEKYGGNFHCSSYQQLEDAFVKQVSYTCM